MPSPNRGGDDSKIAYTRWEPLEASREDPETAVNNNSLPFHQFEEEGIHIIHRRSPVNSKSAWYYDFGIKTLGILIVIGISWIVGKYEMAEKPKVHEMGILAHARPFLEL